MKRKLAFLTALALSVNITALVPMAVNAAITDLDEYYTVGKDYILGLEKDLSVEAFIGKVGEGAAVYESNGTTERVGVIKNGDILEINGSRYILQTKDVQNKVAFIDDFEDGNSNKWGSNAMMSVTEDDKLGSKVLSFDATGASSAAKKSFSVERWFADSPMTGAQVIVNEFDVRYPLIQTQTVSIVMRNTDPDPNKTNKYLATLRTLNKNELHALNKPGYEKLKGGITADSWYHIKYIIDAATGLMDVYIDDEKVNINPMETQAIKNSPGNYIPTNFQIGCNNISESGIVLSLDNFALYEPKPIHVANIAWLDGNVENKNMTSVSVANSGIKVYFSTEETITLDKADVEAAVALYDSNGDIVDANITYNSDEQSCTITSNVLLSNEADYTIKIKDLAEDLYNTKYSVDYTFTTDTVKMPFVIKNVVAEANGETTTDLLKLTQKTEKIYLYFNIQNTTEIDTTGIENKISIVDKDKTPVDITGQYVAADKCYEITLNETLSANTPYYIVIDGLTDTVDAVPYSKEIEINAVPSWVADAGDIVYSDVYEVTSNQIAGIPCGTDVVSIWKDLNLLPGTEAVIYTDGLLDEINTGLILNGNVLVAKNDTLSINKQYTLKTTGAYIISEVYNIGDDYIMNVSDNTSVSDFVNNLTIYNSSNYGVYRDGNEKKTGNVENGDIFKVKSSGKDYTYAIKTHKHDNAYYINDNFDDGNSAEWGSNPLMKIIDDEIIGSKVLAFDATGASASSKKSFTVQRWFADNPVTDANIIVNEFDVRYPLIQKQTVGVIMRNSPDNKYLATLRAINNKGEMYILIPSGYQLLKSGITQDKWYHMQYILDTTTGKMDIYIDDTKMNSTQIDTQAIVNSPGNYIPTNFEIGCSNIEDSGIVLEIDNFQLHQPNPVKVNSLAFVNDNGENYNMRSVSSDSDKIVLAISCEKGHEIKNIDEIVDCVKLVDGNGTELRTENVYDASTGLFTIKITDGLEKNSKYTVLVDGIVDDVYKKSYSDSFNFYTSGEKASFKDAFIINSAGDIVDELSGDEFNIYIPVVNAEEAKTFEVITVFYNEKGRAVKCMTKSLSVDEKSVGEVIFAINLKDIYTSGMYAKVYLKESGNGPLTKPYTIK